MDKTTLLPLRKILSIQPFNLFHYKNYSGELNRHKMALVERCGAAAVKKGQREPEDSCEYDFSMRGTFHATFEPAKASVVSAIFFCSPWLKI